MKQASVSQSLSAGVPPVREKEKKTLWIASDAIIHVGELGSDDISDIKYLGYYLPCWGIAGKPFCLQVNGLYRDHSLLKRLAEQSGN
jgi:hypothetical protein